MRKFFIAIILAIGTLFTFNSNLVLHAQDEKVYTYVEEETGNSITLTLVTESQLIMKIEETEKEPIEVILAYTLNDDILTLVYNEKTLQVRLNPDGTFSEVLDQTVITGDTIFTDEELEALKKLAENGMTAEEFKQYLNSLKEELSADDIDAQKVIKILLSILAGCGGLIVISLYRLIKVKVKEMKNTDEWKSQKEEIQNYLKNLDDKMEEKFRNMNDHIDTKINNVETKRQELYDAQTIKLAQNIEDAKKSLSIDEILDSK